MSFQYILTEIADGILTITLNRPKKYNALGRDLLVEIDTALQAHKSDATVKGVIITGAGEKAFAAGADISEFTGMSAAEGEAMSLAGQAIFRRIETYPKPVIAATNGYTLGAGCELAMSCHMRVASENARFGQPEVNLGLLPGYGGTQRLIQLIGKGKAFELLLTADQIKAAEALRLGLVNYVVPQADLLSTCKEILTKIASKAPIAIAKTIECVDAHFTPGVDGYGVEARTFGECCDTKDFEEGVAAFLGKRAADFKGE